MDSLAIHLKVLGDDAVSKMCIYLVNDMIESGEVKDGKIFFDTLGNVSDRIVGGTFHTSDAYSHKGVILSTSVDGSRNLLNIAAPFKLIYIFGAEKKPNVFQLMTLAKERVRTICQKGQHDEYLRLTGQRLLKTDVVDTINVESIKRICNEDS
jgi:hypothetical protein